MKKKIVAMLLLAVAAAMPAGAKVRYRGFVELPFGVSASREDSYEPLALFPNVGVSTNHGVQFGRWYTGLGLEFGFPEISLFARGRYDFKPLTRRWTPYTQADLGLIVGSWYSNGEFGGSLRLGAGMNLNLWRNLGLDLGVNLSGGFAGSGFGLTFGLRVGLDF